MSVLLDLPQDLIVCLISEWLVDDSLISLQRLDIAFSKHPQICLFRNSLRLAPVDVDVSSCRSFPWMQKCEVNVCGLRLCDDFLPLDEGVNDDEEYKEGLTVINFINTFFSALNSFNALKTLEFSHHSDYFYRIQPSILKNMRKLKFERNVHVERTTELQYIKDHCRNLESLEMYLYLEGLTPLRQSLICDIVDLNPKLVTFFAFILMDTTILRHLQQCRHLKTVRIQVSSVVKSEVDAFIQNSNVTQLSLICDCYCFMYAAEERCSILQFKSILDEEPPNIEEIFRQYADIKWVILSFPTSVSLLHKLHTYCSNVMGLQVNCRDSLVIESALELFPMLKDFFITCDGVNLASCFSKANPQRLENLSLTGSGMTLRQCITLIKSCPKLKWFEFLDKGHDDDDIFAFMDFIQKVFTVTGQRFSFRYIEGSTTLLKYENHKFSGPLFDKVEAESVIALE